MYYYYYSRSINDHVVVLPEATIGSFIKILN